jgi:hypothetical protein
MDGDAPSKVGYRRETGENMLGSSFIARDPNRTVFGAAFLRGISLCRPSVLIAGRNAIAKAVKLARPEKDAKTTALG